MKVASKRTGFNGISICQGSIVRKIEVKAIVNSDDWFAINGLYGVESLFFDPQYFLYFVLVNERKILIAHAIPFLQAQIPLYNSDIRDDVKNWILLTKELCTKASLNIIPRINFKLKIGIRQLVSRLEQESDIDRWRHCVDSVWYSRQADYWQMLFPSVGLP